MKKKIKNKKIGKKPKTTEVEVDGNDEGDDGDTDEPTKKRRPASVSYADFVKLWTNSDTVSEVAEALGIARTSASAIASRLRKEGVTLKNYPRRGSQAINVKELNKIANGKDD